MDKFFVKLTFFFVDGAWWAALQEKGGSNYEDAIMSKRGFASMSPEKRRELAIRGGKAVPAEKRTFSRDPEAARKAGRKGGLSVPMHKRNFFKDHDAAADFGRKGGLACAAKRRAKKATGEVEA